MTALYQLQYDPSATSTDNLIAGELHPLASLPIKMVVAAAGLFYTKSFIAQNVTTNAILQAGVDYQFVGMDEVISAQTGYETASGIALNPSVTSDVSITYQAVGGREGTFNALVSALRDAIAALSTRSVTWDMVHNKLPAYPPAYHQHSILTDLANLEPLRNVMENILRALIGRRAPVISGKAIEDRMDRLMGLIAQLRRDFTLLANIATNRALVKPLSVITQDTTLDSSLAGGTILFNSLTPLNVNLFDIRILDFTTELRFRNIGPGSVTLGHNAGNTVNLDGSNITTLTFASGDTLTLVGQGAVWYKLSGSAHI